MAFSMAYSGVRLDGGSFKYENLISNQCENGKITTLKI